MLVYLVANISKTQHKKEAFLHSFTQVIAFFFRNYFVACESSKRRSI